MGTALREQRLRCTGLAQAIDRTLASDLLGRQLQTAARARLAADADIDERFVDGYVPRIAGLSERETEEVTRVSILVSLRAERSASFLSNQTSVRPVDRGRFLGQARHMSVVQLTRRETTHLLMSGAALALVPNLAQGASADEWREALRKALAAATVPNAGTTLSLVGFGFGRTSGFIGFSAVVQMNWAPGVRKRRFDFTEEGEQETFKILVEAIVAEFQRVNPDGVREVRFR